MASPTFGVAKGARIFGVKVFDVTMAASTQFVINGIDFVVNHNNGGRPKVIAYVSWKFIAICTYVSCLVLHVQPKIWSGKISKHPKSGGKLCTGLQVWPFNLLAAIEGFHN